jgi:hypothetical protein
VLLLVVSETGHVYHQATDKLLPMINTSRGRDLIEDCLGIHGKDAKYTEVDKNGKSMPYRKESASARYIDDRRSSTPQPYHMQESANSDDTIGENMGPKMKRKGSKLAICTKMAKTDLSPVSLSCIVMSSILIVTIRLLICRNLCTFPNCLLHCLRVEAH